MLDWRHLRPSRLCPVWRCFCIPSCLHLFLEVGMTNPALKLWTLFIFDISQSIILFCSTNVYYHVHRWPWNTTPYKSRPSPRSTCPQYITATYFVRTLFVIQGLCHSRKVSSTLLTNGILVNGFFGVSAIFAHFSVNLRAWHLCVRSLPMHAIMTSIFW